MDPKSRRLIARFENDFDSLSANEKYTKEQLEIMKDLEKVMYYIEARDLMRQQQSRPEYMNSPDMEGGGYGVNRNAMGRFTSGAYPMMMDEQRYYDNNGGNGYGYGGYGGNGNGGGGYGGYGNNYGNGYGRRYYDSEKEKAVQYLRKMMGSEMNPDRSSEIQEVIQWLETMK